MATRFAGDFFGIPLTVPGEETSSALYDYYPELKSFSRSTTRSQEPVKDEARGFGGAKAVSPFVGFKTFEKKSDSEFKALPAFAGFKTLEQPK